MKKFLHIFIFLSLFYSCSEKELQHNDISDESGVIIELSDKEFASIAFDSPEELSENAAKDIILNFIESEQKGLPTKTSFIPSISLIGKEILKMDNAHISTKTSADENTDLQSSVYEFKIHNGINEGFALVSGDERSPALIAYVPISDEATYSECVGAQIMLECAKASHLSDIAYIESLKDTLRNKTYARISQELNIPVENLTYESIKNRIRITDDIVTRTNPVTTPPTRIYSFTYPLITTKWDQGAPYNSTHPDIVINKKTGTKGKPYAGCVPVAIAQVFAYCEVSTFRAQGTAVDWRTLKASPTISTTAPLSTRDMIGNLMLEIFQKVGGTYNYDNDGVHNGTGAVYTKYVPYIQKIISTGKRQDYNWTVVQNSLTALEPVIIRGQGHCWILDGYAVCKKSGSAGKSQYDTYVTTNFGWGGHHDGYYKLNDDYSADFLGTYNTTKLMIIPNCKRK